jgi:K+-sensing histidine kinase KdpD
MMKEKEKKRKRRLMIYQAQPQMIWDVSVDGNAILEMKMAYWFNVIDASMSSHHLIRSFYLIHVIYLSMSTMYVSSIPCFVTVVIQVMVTWYMFGL